MQCILYLLNFCINSETVRFKHPGSETVLQEQLVMHSFYIQANIKFEIQKKDMDTQKN